MPLAKQEDNALHKGDAHECRKTILPLAAQQDPQGDE
jgi:hypothetical protein